jgi:SAM-dependent methyltransferase
VTGADGNDQMLIKAFDNAKKYGHVLQSVHADWRWLNRDVNRGYDAVVCLGNSFTHLFDEDDRLLCLTELYSMLKHDGVLILDPRNYDNILDKDFSSKHKYYYCGDKVSVEPVHIDDGLARFEYAFSEGSTPPKYVSFAQKIHAQLIFRKRLSDLGNFS